MTGRGCVGRKGDLYRLFVRETNQDGPGLRPLKEAQQCCWRRDLVRPFAMAMLLEHAGVVLSREIVRFLSPVRMLA